MPGGFVTFYNREVSQNFVLGPISIRGNFAASGKRLYCRSVTPIFRGERNFTAVAKLPFTSWVDAAISASGNVQVAAAKMQPLRTSTDGGYTWQSVTLPPSLSSDMDWSCVAVSGDGSVVVAATRFKFILVSRNGVWVQSRITAAWKSVASSYNGSRIVAAADNNGGIFYSLDYGYSWNQNIGIRYFGKDWTSVSISHDGLSLVAASSWVGQVKHTIPSFYYDFLTLNCTCTHSSPYVSDGRYLSLIPSLVHEYTRVELNPDPSSGIDTYIITFTCTKVPGSHLHGIVTSLADQQSERRLFCSSDSVGESWKAADFDDSTWQLPSVLNLSTVQPVNNGSDHIANVWVHEKPSKISSSSQILWAPNITLNSFSCRYKLPAMELRYQDWIDYSGYRYPNIADEKLLSELWRRAVVSERGTTWSAPTPLGFTTNAPIACNGADVGPVLYNAQLACERCIECHSILRVGTNPGIFSLRTATTAYSEFEQQTSNAFFDSGFRPGPYPPSFMNSQGYGRSYNMVTDTEFQSNMWFLGRQVGIAESQDFGRTWFARSSQRHWSSALISSDGQHLVACSNGNMMKADSLNNLQISLSFTNIPSAPSDPFQFSIFGSVLRGTGVVSMYSSDVAANSYIHIPLVNISSFTVMFWLKTSSSCSSTSWQSGCQVFYASAMKSSYGIYIAAGALFLSIGESNFIRAPKAVNDARWHFIAASWNSSTGAMKVYIDGELVAIGDSMIKMYAQPQEHSIKLGGSAVFAGSFDDFRIFSVELEPATIENVYNRSAQLSIPYGASPKFSFEPVDDEMQAPFAGSCSTQNPKSFAMSSDSSHILAVLQPPDSQPSIYDFNSNRRLGPLDCVDADECALGTHNCTSSQLCINTAGSFMCSCLAGFSSVGSECIDIDECSVSAPCGPTMNCVNSVGSFSCVCKSGFGNVGCVDLDECGAAVFPCPFKSVCSNTVGSFTCTCPAGTVLIDNACVDIDECATALHNCGPNTCINTFGAFRCECSSCTSRLFGFIKNVFTGVGVSSAEVYVLRQSSAEMIASAVLSPADMGAFSIDVNMSPFTDISYRLFVKSFYNADIYAPVTVFANQSHTHVNVSVFQYCESVLAAAASNANSGCINVDPNMFIAVPSSVSISKIIRLFGSDFPLTMCEARIGINITADPTSYWVATSCNVTSSFTAIVSAHNSSDTFVPLQVQLIFRVGADILKVLTSQHGILVLLNGTAIIQSVSPALGEAV
jgi:hypothetical protein